MTLFGRYELFKRMESVTRFKMYQGTANSPFAICGRVGEAETQKPLDNLKLRSADQVLNTLDAQYCSNCHCFTTL